MHAANHYNFVAFVNFPDPALFVLAMTTDKKPGIVGTSRLGIEPKTFSKNSLVIDNPSFHGN